MTTKRQTRRRTGPVWEIVEAAVLFGAALLFGGGLIWIAIQFRGVTWALSVISAHIGAMGWIVCLFIVLWLAVEIYQRLRARANVGEIAAPPRRNRLPGAVLMSALGIAGAGSLNIATSRVVEFWESRKQEGVDIYKNHDLALLVGQCVRLAILRHAQSLGDTPKADALRAVAEDVPLHWEALVSANDPRVLALADGKLIQFIQEPRAKALGISEWSSMLEEWRTAVRADDLEPGDITQAAATVAHDFGITLREALKADFEKGGKAWAAMQLDIAQSLINRTPVVDAEKDAQMTASLELVRAMLADDARGLPALRSTILAVRQAEEEHAQEVARRFDQLVGMLARLQTDVTTLKGYAEISLINFSLLAQIMRIDADVRLTPEEKMRRMEPLLAQIIDATPVGIPAPPIPAPVQSAVARTFANASPVRRIGPLWRIGLDKEADELLMEIEHTASGLSDPDKYQLFLARGDRYWTSKDYWNAVTWYAQAMALRVDEPGSVYRAAKSAVLAPGRDNYNKDLQLAQSWVERCLRTPAAQEQADPMRRADLLALLSTMLMLLGKSSESISPAEEALAILDRSSPSLDNTPSIVYVAVAEALLLAGKLPEANRIADRAMEAATNPGGPDWYPTVAFVAATRSIIRQHRGDLQGAEEDIATSITFGNAQPAHYERQLAAWYARRASIRRDRGNLTEAEQDIDNSIKLDEQLFPRDERQLAISYEIRASVLRARGLHSRALSDVEVSIKWGEQQSPRDRRTLAVGYHTRAAIRADLNDRKGAIEDITLAITWAEEQSPRDERGLAIMRATRASIRERSNDLEGAMSDITYSIDWAEAQILRNERALAIWHVTRGNIRGRQGDLQGAIDDLTGSITWGEKQLPRNEREIATWCFFRAGFRRDQGDLRGAEVDISRSVAWNESQDPRNEDAYARDLTMRATIRQRLGDLHGAEADIDFTITWGKSQIPPDETGMATCYATRAGIRQESGDTMGAQEDIERAITWGESQSLRNERSLSMWYAIRSRISQDRGDGQGAEEDISRSIRWIETQSQPDARLYASCLALRARIREERRDYATAVEDITRSITWGESQSPKDERLLAIWYGARARILVELDRIPQAVAEISNCITWYRQHQPQNGYRMAAFLHWQARILAISGAWDSSLAAIDESVVLHEATFGTDHEWTTKAKQSQTHIAGKRVPDH